MCSILFGCTTDAKLSLSDLPQMVYVSTNDGTTYAPSSPENPPANALSYSQIDNLIRDYGTPRVRSLKYNDREALNYSYNNHIPPDSEDTFVYKNGNILFRPRYSNYYGDYWGEITYLGNMFVSNQNGFAEQTTGEVEGRNFWYNDYKDGFITTKLVLGGGVNNLLYTDFGYWIGVPKNTTKDVIYMPFAIMVPHAYGTPANTSFTGKTAAVAYTENVVGSARELSGNATLTLDGSKNANLHLAFENYYTFDINSDNYGGGFDFQTVSSVAVSGVNSNGGPAFSSCTSNCSSAGLVDYMYSGQYSAEEAAGTYKYTNGGNTLTGSFGAKLDN